MGPEQNEKESRQRCLAYNMVLLQIILTQRVSNVAVSIRPKRKEEIKNNKGNN